MIKGSRIEFPVPPETQNVGPPVPPVTQPKSWVSGDPILELDLPVTVWDFTIKNFIMMVNSWSVSVSYSKNPTLYNSKLRIEGHRVTELAPTNLGLGWGWREIQIAGGSRRA